MIVNDDFVIVCGFRILFRGTEADISEYFFGHPWDLDFCDVLTWEEYCMKLPPILEDVL